MDAKSLMLWFSNWYSNQCNGDWEHRYGISIETLDNPGWSIEVDLKNTTLDTLSDIKWSLFELDSSTWVGYKIDNQKLYISVVNARLDLGIFMFKQISDRVKVNRNMILSYLSSD